MVLGHLSAVAVFGQPGTIERRTKRAQTAANGGALECREKVIEQEEVLKANGFLIIAHGSAEEMARVRTILEAFSPAGVDMHKDVREVPAQHDAHAGHHATA